MNKRRMLVATLLFLAMPAFAATTGAAATRVNQIVGAWSNQATVGPCGGTAGPAQYQTVVFNAGGTFLDNPRFPPGGILNANGIPGTNQRSIGVGTWSYDHVSGEYTVDQRFDWYVDNVYNGYQTVHRSILLSNDGNQGAGPVETVRYATDGSVVSQQCGNATATRL